MGRWLLDNTAESASALLHICVNKPGEATVIAFPSLFLKVTYASHIHKALSLKHQCTVKNKAEGQSCTNAGGTQHKMSDIPILIRSMGLNNIGPHSAGFLIPSTTL